MSDSELIDVVVERVCERLDRKFKGLYDVLNSLSERLTGEQFTLVEGPSGARNVVTPELRRVMWHPVVVQGGVGSLCPDHAAPTENRYPEPCVVRRAMYEISPEIDWESCGLAKRLEPSL